MLTILCQINALVWGAPDTKHTILTEDFNCTWYFHLIIIIIIIIPSTVLSYYVPGLIVHCKEEEEKVL